MQAKLIKATFVERHPGATAVHKFMQKFRFKGPWDATEKIVKEARMNCKLQYTHCSNALDCYEQLTERMARDGNGKHQTQ